MDQASIYAILQTHGKLDNTTAHRVAKLIWSDVLKYGKFWEKEGAKEEAEKHTKDAEDVPMTREELIKYLAKSVKGGNTQAGKLLSELEGFDVVSKELEIKMVDYKDAPDYFFVSKPPETVK